MTFEIKSYDNFDEMINDISNDCGMTAEEFILLDRERYEVSQVSQVSQDMIKYGGSFAQHLGQTLACADSKNMKKIKETFRYEWDHHMALWNQREVEKIQYGISTKFKLKKSKGSADASE